ncbi:MAG: hypothetical protein AB1505_35350, partial [Candidatus Latescibacterota bacterium]
FGVAAGLVGRTAGPSVLGDRYGDGLSYRDFQSIWVSGEGERRLFPGYSVVLLAVLSLFSKAPTTRHIRPLLLLLAGATLLISLGPVIVVLGHLTYVPGPYALLYYLVPGLKGMRATARFGYVTVMSVAALAAIGWSVAGREGTKTLAPLHRHRGLACAVLLGLWIAAFTAENLPAERVQHGRPEPPPPIYQWLRVHPVQGGIVELPTFKGSMRKTDPVYGARRVDYAVREYLYMFYSMEHWKPVYNGFGAFISPLQFRVRDAIQGLPDKTAVAELKGLGLQTIVVHDYWLEPEDREFWQRPDVLGALEVVTTVGGATVYRLR